MNEFTNLLANDFWVLLTVLVLAFLTILFTIYFGKLTWNGWNGSYLGGYWKDTESQKKTDES
ncbi:hypothetical protein [Rhodopirellula bahusiensis]|uniref:hypothetical protein n=1 Tax=Rhodopirellula bahusiensis TaxID=2014065 RepID=UPI0032647652